ncbi:MAG: acyl carrier protein [Deltaproteobacteria bacterium]|nr:acyl carrier protein [Deltaproteobacteria bacterium]
MALSNEQIFAHVVGILEREFDVTAAEMTMKTDLEADLDLDSLDAVALAGFVEEELPLALTDDEIERMRSMDQIVAVISARTGAAGKAD